MDGMVKAQFCFESETGAINANMKSSAIQEQSKLIRREEADVIISTIKYDSGGRQRTENLLK